MEKHTSSKPDHYFTMKHCGSSILLATSVAIVAHSGAHSAGSFGSELGHYGSSPVAFETAYYDSLSLQGKIKVHDKVQPVSRRASVIQRKSAMNKFGVSGMSMLQKMISVMRKIESLALRRGLEALKYNCKVQKAKACILRASHFQISMAFSHWKKVLYSMRQHSIARMMRLRTITQLHSEGYVRTAKIKAVLDRFSNSILVLRVADAFATWKGILRDVDNALCQANRTSASSKGPKRSSKYSEQHQQEEAMKIRGSEKVQRKPRYHALRDTKMNSSADGRLKGMPNLTFFVAKSAGADRRFRSEKLHEASKHYIRRPWNK